MSGNNEVAVITGGNRGIGADITRRFLDGGYQVVNISRQTPEFSHERLVNYTADLADTQATLEVGEEIAGQYAVTSFVHNAGVIRPDLLEDVKLEDLDYLTQLHLGSAITLAQQFIPAMRSAQFGRIILISSRGVLGLGHPDKLCSYQGRPDRHHAHLGAGTGKRRDHRELRCAGTYRHGHVPRTGAGR